MEKRNRILLATDPHRGIRPGDRVDDGHHGPGTVTGIGWHGPIYEDVHYPDVTYVPDNGPKNIHGDGVAPITIDLGPVGSKPGSLRKID